jgi:hypothetical protein
MKTVRLGELLDGLVRSVSEAMHPGVRADDGLDQSLIARALRQTIAFYAGCLILCLGRPRDSNFIIDVCADQIDVNGSGYACLTIRCETGGRQIFGPVNSPAINEFDRFFYERYPVSTGTLAIVWGCSWNGQLSRDERISPLEVGLTTLRLRSFDWSRAGLLTNPLKAQSRGLMPLRYRYRWSQPHGTPCFASLRTLL